MSVLVATPARSTPQRPRRQFLRRSLAAASALTALVTTVGVTALASPAQAVVSVGTHWQNWGNNNCLDSNYAGDVYTKACQAGNNWQTWDVYQPYPTIDPNYWAIKNRQTQRCLNVNWSSTRSYVLTVTCDHPGTGYWMLQGPDWGNVKLVGDDGGPNFEDYCIDSGHQGEGPVADHALVPGGRSNCNYGLYQTWRSIG